MFKRPLVHLAACVAVLGAGCRSEPASSELSISPGQIALARVDGSAAPPAQTIEIRILAPDAAYIVAGLPPGTAPAPWLALRLWGDADGWALQVGVSPVVMTPGTYETTVRIAIARADGSVIAYRDARVTYVLQAGFAVSMGSTLSPELVLGSSIGIEYLVDVVGTSGIAFTAASDQPWLESSAPGGIVPTSLAISADPAGLALGTHHATLTFDGGPAPIVVDVALTVVPPDFDGETSLALTGTAGRSAMSDDGYYQLGVGANSYPWVVTGAPAWLEVSPASGTIGSTSTRITFVPDATVLPPGMHVADLEIKADVGGTPITRPVAVTLLLAAPALSVPEALALGGVTGHDFTPEPFEISLDTGANPFAFTASSPAPWAAVTPASGTVSSAPVALGVAPTPEAIATLPGGTYTSTVEVAASVNGVEVTRSIPLTLVLDEHMLLLDEEGVAFTSLPSSAVLTRGVPVRSSRGILTDWSATSDRPWLSVTANGTTGDSIILAADPMDLPADALSEATVTVTSGDPTIPSARTIRVVLWKGSSDPDAVSLASTYTNIAADPVRPLLYATAGGTDVTVFHVFSGAAVRTISGVGTELAALAVSGDGARLFVVDEAAHTINPIDLATDVAGTPWPITAGITAVSLTWARPGRLPVVLASDGVVRHASTGAEVGDFRIFAKSGLGLSAARDGSGFCTANPTCALLDQSAEGDRIVISRYISGHEGWYPLDVAMSGEGARVYGAFYATSGFPVWDATGTLLLQPLPRLASDTDPNAIEVGADGRIYGTVSKQYAAKDLWVHDAAGNLRGSYLVSGWLGRVRDRGLAVSGDGLRMMVLTDDPTLQFLSTPP